LKEKIRVAKNIGKERRKGKRRFYLMEKCLED
jgi:hypothetical protein